MSTSLERHLRDAFDRDDWIRVAIELRDSPANSESMAALSAVFDEYEQMENDDGEATWSHLDFLLRFLDTEGGRRVLADAWLYSSIPIPRQVMLAMPKPDAIDAMLRAVEEGPELVGVAGKSAFTLANDLSGAFLESLTYCQRLIDILPLPAEGEESDDWKEWLRPLAQRAQQKIAGARKRWIAAEKSNGSSPFTDEGLERSAAAAIREA